MKIMPDDSVRDGPIQLLYCPGNVKHTECVFRCFRVVCTYCL